MRTPNFYTSGEFDRANDRRRDDAWLDSRLTDESTRFLVLWRDQQLMFRGDDGVRPLLLGVGALGKAGRQASQTVFLGVDAAGIATFSVDLSTLSEPTRELDLPPEVQQSASFEALRMIGAQLVGADAALLAYARGIANWHNRHRFCGVCGSPTKSIDGGHVRLCSNSDCAAQHFPRTDPAVIMLVTDGDRCLLGRQKVWPPGMHSTLAGFVEPGESLEHAVAREVKEECGIEVDDVVYKSSQPWPFPASVMLGFHARAVTTTLKVDPAELERADWYTRSFLQSHRGDATFCVPPRDSIAFRLINDWLENG
jgi:NAD+ diphosphatase